ncbi:unnamed protein product [Trifolium pratense]|uniref:Uncharacterized protein n=1 Tax=Trifolium pratense TaxID=57577 RepID=A0ACB0KH75_TRIPR|nr:unnamed protein product [Trifolium pratense]
MQITGSLLSNLLDVVEEVQLARVEIRNFVQAFNSHSVCQKSMQKVQNGELCQKHDSNRALFVGMGLQILQRLLA